jgi:hypothetical protein
MKIEMKVTRGQRMKKSLVMGLCLVATQSFAGYTLEKKVGDIDTKMTFYGFAQLEAVGGEGMDLKYDSANEANADISFRAQRIRLGWNYVAGKIRGKVFLDFNEPFDSVTSTNGASIPKVVKDAFISYHADDACVIKAGLIKMPHGMSFTIPGWNLDIAERGFDKALMLERNIGLMISGRDMGLGNNGKVNGFEMGHERPWKGFGYDLMIANQANRSGGASYSSPMGGNAYAARGMFDYTEKLHIEASYAVSNDADGNATLGSSDLSYKSLNIGLDSNLQELSIKSEYTTGSDMQGIDGYDETTLSATIGYFVMPELELIGKYITGSAIKGSSANETELVNTYLGFNLFLDLPKSDFSRKSKRGRNQHKVVFNYIIASGSGASEDPSKKWTGLKGYRANAFIAQYQYKF